MIPDALVSYEPRSSLDASVHMREAASAGLRVAIVGGATHSTPKRNKIDAVLSTRGMARVIEYAPEDQTVTVEAGITLAELARELAIHDQRLVAEVAEPDRATIGGAIAANAFGPRRLTYGSLKDLILGVTIVRADGTQAHAGGRVVKNVAGFDLSKLMVGSFGTLALVTEVTLRVHPLPEATRAFRTRSMAPDRVWDFITAIRDRQVEPAAVLAFRDPDASTYSIDVLLEGFTVGVAARVDTLVAIASDGAWEMDELAPAFVEDRDATVRRSGPLRVRCATPAADFGVVDHHIIAPLLRALDDPRMVGYPALGIAFVAGTPRDPAVVGAVIESGRADAERRGGSLVVEMLPTDDGYETVDRWGTPPASFPLMRQLKSRFDPNGRLNPGSFVGGL